MANSNVEIKIDPDFSELLAPYEEGEHVTSLEEDCIKNGIRDPLTLWNGFLIDGHRRKKISEDNGLPFKTVDYSDKLSSKQEVLYWIRNNQLNRRNLTEAQRKYERGKLYSEMKLTDKEKNRGRSNQHEEEIEGFEKIDTAAKIGSDNNLNPRTIRREEQFSIAIDKIAEATNEDIKGKILSGKITGVTQKDIINLGFKDENEIVTALDGIRKGRTEDLKTSIKLSKIKINTDELKENEHEFCRLYVKHDFDSLKAYSISFKEIIKIRASQQLGELNRWVAIMKILKTWEGKSPYQEKILEDYEAYEAKHGCTVFEAYEHLVSIDDHAPKAKIIIMLCDMFRFFELLKRNKFMKKVQDAIDFYMNRLKNQIAGGNESYREELKKIPRYTEDILSQIIHLN